MFVGFLLLVVIVGGSINVVFADQDIHSLLTNWFNKEKDDSITELEKAISVEQDVQTERLKETLQKEITEAQAQLHTFTENEIDKRVHQLQSHADELIKSVSIDNADEKNRVTQELEAILQEAQQKMGTVNVEKKPISKTDKLTEEKPVSTKGEEKQSKQSEQTHDKVKIKQGAE